jgi:hypothetical protein
VLWRTQLHGKAQRIFKFCIADPQSKTLKPNVLQFSCMKTSCRKFKQIQYCTSADTILQHAHVHCYAAKKWITTIFAMFLSNLCRSLLPTNLKATLQVTSCKCDGVYLHLGRITL